MDRGTYRSFQFATEQRLVRPFLLLLDEVEDHDRRPVPLQTAVEVPGGSHVERTAPVDADGRLGHDPLNILGPEPWHRSTQLNERSILPTAVRNGGRLVHYLFRLHLVCYVSVIVHSSLHVARPGIVAGPAGYQRDVERPGDI